jgi:hypothetical protein
MGLCRWRCVGLRIGRRSGKTQRQHGENRFFHRSDPFRKTLTIVDRPMRRLGITLAGRFGCQIVSL